MKFEVLIDELSQRLGLSVQNIGESCISFDVDTNKVVNIYKLDVNILIKTSLGVLKENTLEERKLKFRDLLHSSAAMILLDNTVLSIDLNKNEIILHKKMPLNALTVSNLEIELEKFLNTVDYYNNTL